MTHSYKRKFIVPSSSKLGKKYLVSLTEYGEWQCSCPHWIYRHLECNHIRKVKENPSKYEVDTYHTTDQLELNPTRRDNKDLTSSIKDNPSIRFLSSVENPSER